MIDTMSINCFISFTWGVLFGIAYGLALAFALLLFLSNHPEFTLELYIKLEKMLYKEKKFQDKSNRDKK